MIRCMYELRPVYSGSDYAPEMYRAKKRIILLLNMLCAVVVQNTCPIQADDLFMCHLAKWIAYFIECRGLLANVMLHVASEWID